MVGTNTVSMQIMLWEHKYIGLASSLVDTLFLTEPMEIVDEHFSNHPEILFK